MPQDRRRPDDSMVPGKAMRLRVEKLAYAALAVSIVSILLICAAKLDILQPPKWLIGVCPSTFILVFLAGAALLLWERSKGEPPRYRLFRYMWFWLLTTGLAVAMVVAILRVLFDMGVLRPEAFPPSYRRDLDGAQMATFGFMLLALLMTIYERSRVDIADRHRPFTSDEE